MFTLGLFANCFSLKSLSLFAKSHMNVLCALKLTELWNTNLLLDLKYKYILMTASLLGLAKSIYYLVIEQTNNAFKHCLFVCKITFSESVLFL